MTTRKDVPSPVVTIAVIGALVFCTAATVSTAVGAETGKTAASCDLPRAQRVATQCMICHTLGEDEGSSVGPGLWGIYGRKAATVEGFPYSKAFRALTLTWDDAELDRFLAQPMTVVPGTMMAFAGLKDPADRAAIICRLEASR